MLFLGASHNAGQVCFTMKRLFIHERIYDAVKAELIAMAKEVKLGNPFDPDVTMGPVQNKAQYDRLRCVYVAPLSVWAFPPSQPELTLCAQGSSGRLRGARVQDRVPERGPARRREGLLHPPHHPRQPSRRVPCSARRAWVESLGAYPVCARDLTPPASLQSSARSSPS